MRDDGDSDIYHARLGLAPLSRRDIQLPGLARRTTAHEQLPVAQFGVRARALGDMDEWFEDEDPTCLLCRSARGSSYPASLPKVCG